MNIKQIQYALELAKVRSFSLCAARLEISQPSLSKQIQNLEEELGIKLFDRSTVPMKLTPAGDFFLQRAQGLLFQGEQLVRSLDGFRSGHAGVLTIGVSPFRNLYLMPKIIDAFHKVYPLVQVELRELSSDQLRREAAAGTFDLAIVNLPVDEAVLETILLEPEYLAVAVPKRLLHLIHRENRDPEEPLDFACFRDLPFCVVSRSQEMRRYFDSLCASRDITPRISVEVAGGLTAAWSMARAGLGATLLPIQLLTDADLGEDLTLFPIQDSAYTRQPAVVTRRDRYLSEPARYAIRLLTER